MCMSAVNLLVISGVTTGRESGEWLLFRGALELKGFAHVVFLDN